MFRQTQQESHEMKKMELKERDLKAQTGEKKSLLIKQRMDEYDNLKIEDLPNRDMRLKVRSEQYKYQWQRWSGHCHN